MYRFSLSNFQWVLYRNFQSNSNSVSNFSRVVLYRIFPERSCIKFFQRGPVSNFSREVLYRIFQRGPVSNFPERSCIEFPEWSCIEFFQRGPVSNFSREVLYRIFPERFRIECPKTEFISIELN